MSMYRPINNVRGELFVGNAYSRSYLREYTYKALGRPTFVEITATDCLKLKITPSNKKQSSAFVSQVNLDLSIDDLTKWLERNQIKGGSYIGDIIEGSLFLSLERWE